MKSDLIKKLSQQKGTFKGRGLNHEKQTFDGVLTLIPLLSGLGISLHFRATGEDGAVFHEEYTTIAPTLTDGLYLFNLNSNMPGLVSHKLIREESSSPNVECAVFAFEDRANKNVFREEITLELHSNGGIAYKYAWGMPQGEFADRSGAMMLPI